MSATTDLAREYLVALLDILRRRWMLIAAPVLAASLLSMAAVKLSPMKYEASSLIMLQAANRVPSGAGGGFYANTMEQVQAVEAWLKSDQVLADLVPRMTGYKPPDSPIAAAVQMRLLAASLSLEVVGNSVLQIKMQSDKPEGLGRNLDTVLSRLMEGLTGPEQSIFSAPQFVQLRRKEEVAAAEAELMRAIEATGAETPYQVRLALKRLWNQKHVKQATAERAAGLAPASTKPVEHLTTNDADMLQSLRLDAAVLSRLESLYDTYQNAVDRLASANSPAGSSRNNFVSIFSSPDDLLIIGRPKDPVAGESAARKIAIAITLLSVVLGGALVVLAELMSGVLRTRRDFNAASGLPVLARLPDLQALKT